MTERKINVRTKKLALLAESGAVTGDCITPEMKGIDGILEIAVAIQNGIS